MIGDTDSTTEPGAPAVFLLHGFMESKRQWEGLGKTIQTLTKRPVVAVDLRNHGDSPHADSHTYHDLAQDVIKLLSRLSVSRASLIGYSMGGMASMCMSLIAPEKVAGILIVDISPVSDVPQIMEFFPQLLNAMSEINFEGHTKVRKARRFVKKKIKSFINDDITLKTVLSNVNVLPAGHIGWTCNIDVLIRHYNDLIRFPRSLKRKKYLGPALFVGGQLSDFLSPDDMPGIREMFPQAVITYIPGTCHSVQIDDPRTFLEFAIAFIRTND